MAEIIFKSSAAIAISYFIYFSIIRNNAGFKWIRFYFLIAIAASFAVPLLMEFIALRQQTWIQIPNEYIRAFLADNEGGLKAKTAVYRETAAFPLYTVALWVYFTGVFAVLLKFLTGFFHLLFLAFKNGIQKVGTDKMVFLQSLPYPFSFLHLIFINRQTLSDASCGAMLQHERVHIRQWHSLDLILLELLVAFQWFNPLAWLLRRSLKELHEYLADEETIKLQPSPLDYQLLLFNQVCGTTVYNPVNGFKNSLTKKRILMIRKKRNNRGFAAFAALVVAIFAIQAMSRINFAQDPPAKGKQQKQKMTTVDPATKKYPPDPPPFPYSRATNNFEENTLELGEYLMKNINQLPTEFVGSSKRNGLFVAVTYDNNKGKVIKAEKGIVPKVFLDGYDVKFTEDPQILNKVIDLLKNAPDFKITKATDDIVFRANYGIIFSVNTCKAVLTAIEVPNKYK